MKHLLIQPYHYFYCSLTKSAWLSMWESGTLFTDFLLISLNNYMCLIPAHRRTYRCDISNCSRYVEWSTNESFCVTDSSIGLWHSRLMRGWRKEHQYSKYYFTTSELASLRSHDRVFSWCLTKNAWQYDLTIQTLWIGTNNIHCMRENYTSVCHLNFLKSTHR